MRDRNRHIEIPEMTETMARYLSSMPPRPPEPPVMIQDPLFEYDAEAAGE